MVIMSISIREYHIPYGRKMPGIPEWIRFAVFGKLFKDDTEKE